MIQKPFYRSDQHNWSECNKNKITFWSPYNSHIINDILPKTYNEYIGSLPVDNDAAAKFQAHCHIPIPGHLLCKSHLFCTSRIRFKKFFKFNEKVHTSRMEGSVFGVNISNMYMSISRLRHMAPWPFVRHPKITRLKSKWSTPSYICEER